MRKSQLKWLAAAVSAFFVASCASEAPKETRVVNAQTASIVQPQTKVASKLAINQVQLPVRETIHIPFTKARTKENFADYVEQLKVLARANGINEETLTIAFKDVYFIERVVKADKSQPEKKISFTQYVNTIASPKRIALAKEKYQTYQSQLKEASQLTGVPEEYILSLWGIESGYGRNQGKEDIISAVSTLAFDGRREAFFARELIAALHILQEGHITKEKFKGSWAGAMGQNQFMPSSYIAYGKDGDNDGLIDIWTNITDVFASTGNYLGTVGWDKSERWGNRVTLPKKFNSDLAGLDDHKAKTVTEWKKLGVTFTQDEPTQLKSTSKAWLIYPDADDTTVAYLVSNNFKTIMHWNRSYYFAVSVGKIADQLGR